MEKEKVAIKCVTFFAPVTQREANFPFNSAEIMTKKLILVAKEAQLERRVACGWNDIKIVACPVAGLFNY